MQYGIAQSVAGMTYFGIALSNLTGGSPASLEHSYRGPLAHAGGFIGGETGARLGAVGDVGVGLASLRLDIRSSQTGKELLWNASSGGAGAIDDIDAAVTEFSR
jgi:hypothetical protein